VRFYLFWDGVSKVGGRCRPPFGVLLWSTVNLSHNRHKEFVNGVFKAARERFGEKRKSGARPMCEVGWKGEREGKGAQQRGGGVAGTSSRLYTMRALRKDVVE
jgi:hypothetical protein